MEIGFKLCSEERSARDLVLDAWRAEEAGFALVAASDHFHPWLEAQGEASAVWPVLGVTDLPTPRSFEEEARGADVSAIRRGIPMGPDPLRAIERARAYRDAGFSRLVVHQIGPDPTPFFLRLAKPLLAEFRSARGSIEEQPQGRPLEAFSEHLGQDATRAGEAVRVEPSEKFRVLDLR